MNYKLPQGILCSSRKIGKSSIFFYPFPRIAIEYMLLILKIILPTLICIDLLMYRVYQHVNISYETTTKSLQFIQVIDRIYSYLPKHIYT